MAAIVLQIVDGSFTTVDGIALRLEFIHEKEHNRFRWELERQDGALDGMDYSELVSVLRCSSALAGFHDVGWSRSLESW